MCVLDECDNSHLRFAFSSCNFVVVTICCLILLLLPKRFSDGRDLLFATTLLPLISPILWFHHLVWLVPVIFLLANKVRNTFCVVLLGCTILLLSFSMPLQIYLRVLGIESNLVGAAMIYLAITILWGILILEAVQKVVSSREMRGSSRDKEEVSKKPQMYPL